MKTKLLAILIAALLLGAALYYSQSRTPETMAATERTLQARTGPPFPDIIFSTPDNRAFRITDLKEPTVLVHFWAAWCAPCRDEFPGLLQYVANAHGKVALLAISLDSNYQNSEKMLRDIENKHNISSEAPHIYWAWDRNKAISLHHFNTVKVPETIVVNDKRQMIDKIIGEGPWAQTSTKK